MSVDEPTQIDKLSRNRAPSLNLFVQNYLDEEVLLKALTFGKYDVAKRLILAGADVNYTNKMKWNALHYAAKNGLLEIAQCILDKEESDIDARTDKGQTALSIATSEGHEQMVELLLKYGADIVLRNTYAKVNGHCKGEPSWTLLHHACFRGWVRVAQAIVKKCDLEAKTETGATALMMAVKMENRELAKLLLLSGASASGIDREQWNVLHYACSHGWLDVVKLIAEQKPSLEDRTYQNQTPLLISVKKGHKKIAEFLMESGASTGCSDWNSWSLLHHASHKGWSDMVEHVLKLGSCDINAKVFLGESALMLALDSKHFEVVELLLKYGADQKVKNYSGNTAFTCAVEYGSSVEMIALFIKYGAYFDATDYWLLSNRSVLKDAVLKNRDLCIQAVINEYNNYCLPAACALAGTYNIVLPAMDKFKIKGGYAKKEIEKVVDWEIRTQSFCNIIKVRPLVLSMLSVRSLFDYHRRKSLRNYNRC